VLGAGGVFFLFFFPPLVVGKARWMDGWMDGWKEGRKEERKEGIVRCNGRAFCLPGETAHPIDRPSANRQAAAVDDPRLEDWVRCVSI